MSKFCPACGEELVDTAKFCKNCGKNLEKDEYNPHVQVNHQQTQVQSVEKSHTLAIVLGYICAILISLIGVIISIYLMTRDDSEKARKHGKYILIVSIIFWILPWIFRL